MKKTSLSWPVHLRSLEEFHQDQNKVPVTGPVECVTTTVVVSRNIMNVLLSSITGKPALPDMLVQDFVKILDAKGWRGLIYRFPTSFPDIHVPLLGLRKLNPRGFMLPRVQAVSALKYFSSELKDYYGISFTIHRKSGSTLEDITANLVAGNLVLVHGLFSPHGREQRWLNGHPHTFGPVLELDMERGQVSLVDTGSKAITTLDTQSFMEFWERKSLLDLYSRPRSMTVLVPDTTRASCFSKIS